MMEQNSDASTHQSTHQFTSLVSECSISVATREESIIDHVGEKSAAKEKIEGQDKEQGEEEEEEFREEVEDHGPLCPIVCDFLCDFDTLTPGILFDRQISRKILSGFRKCDIDEPCQPKDEDDGTASIDIRGHYSTEALELMVAHLYCWSDHPDVKKLLVRVGCRVHGCGEGKLKKEVTALLDRDTTWPIQYKYEDHDDSIIAITLDNRTDYSGIGWPLKDLMKSETMLKASPWF